MREDKGKLDLVINGLSVTAALDRHTEGSGTSPEGRASETEGAHRAIEGGGRGGDGSVSRFGLGVASCKGRRPDTGCSLAPFRSRDMA